MVEHTQFDESKSSAKTASTTVASSVYDQIRLDILTGDLRPGEKLRSEFLRDRYKAGISPVREALNRLATERLVSREDQRGFHVAGVSKADLIELTKTRCWLEDIALRESIEKGDDAWEEKIVLAFHRLSRTPRSSDETTYVFNANWEGLHSDFHNALLASCDSHWLFSFCQQLVDQADRYRQLAAAVSYPKRNERDEHQALMEAALNRDADSAAAIQCAHIRKTADIVLEANLSFLPDKIEPAVRGRR
ncbi:MAG: DNA-binding GntR family transcriptional regulator [Alphaproteobacteria bacterium]|jgi:DNA-binding GntR family transcriptional regulator